MCNFFDSIYQKFPVGQIIFWRPTDMGKHRPEFRRTTGLPEIEPELYLVDGQQRLLSLYYAFNDEASKIDLKQYVVAESKNKQFRKFKTVKNKITQNEKLWESSSEIRKILEAYQIPTAIVDCNKETAYQLFQRINAGNTPLSGLKFIISIYAQNTSKNLAQLDDSLTKLCDEIHLQRKYLEDLYEELICEKNLMAYAQTHKGDKKKIGSDYSKFEGSVYGVKKTYSDFKLDHHAFNTDLFKQLVKHEHNSKGKITDSDFLRIVLDWNEFKPSSTQKISKSELSDFLDNEEAIDEHFLGILLSLNRAIDYQSKRTYVQGLYKPELHHIFPQSKYRKFIRDPFNWTFISDIKNTEIGNQDPAQQYANCDNSEFWSSHFVSRSKTLAALKANDANEFTRLRKEEIVEFIYSKLKT